jgi:predicted MFS family arabinose efflux permease
MLGELVIGFATFLLTVLSLLVTQGLGLDDATLGLSFAAISTGGFTCAFLGGVLADRLGPRFVALTGLSATCVGGVTVAFAPNAFALAVGQFLLGAAIGIYGVTAYAWVNETLGNRRGVFLGVFAISLVLALIAAALAVAEFLRFVGSWRTFYSIAAVLALAPMAPLWFLLPPHLYVPVPRRAVRAALRNRDVLLTGAQQLLVGVYSSGYSWIPLFLIQQRGYGVTDAALALVASGILWAVGSVFFGRWADRGWPLPVIALGAFGGAASFALFTLWDIPAVYVTGLLVFSFLWPASAAVPLTFLGQQLGATAQRTEVGVLENSFLLGDGIGAAAIGSLATVWTLRWGMTLLPTAAAVAAGMLFVATYGVRRNHE